HLCLGQHVPGDRRHAPPDEFSTESVHHPGVEVVLELQYIVGGIDEHEGEMLLDQSLKTLRWLLKKGQLSLASKVQQRVKFPLVFEGHAKMARIRLRIQIDLIGVMTY